MPHISIIVIYNIFSLTLLSSIMLVFIVPLQSPSASHNWHHVSLLVKRTLLSLFNQESSEFIVLLVCNESPIDCPAHPNLCIIKRNFPIPDRNTASRMMDKWNKVHVGLVVAREYASSHVMVVDADDCVSRRLADYCSKHTEESGWYFDSGWMHDEGSHWIFDRPRDFYSLCGTSSIVRIKHDELPLTESFNNNHIILRSGHGKIRANMKAAETPLAPLPFRGAVYNLANGENDSHFSLASWKSRRVLINKFFHYRPLTKSIRREFCLYDIKASGENI